jgi:hypothetical protein
MTATLTWVCLPPDCARAAVATSAAHYDPHDFDIDTLFWGELIFLALFVSSFLLWKAIEGRGNRTTLNGVAMKEDSKDSWDPEVPDPEITWDPKDLFGEPWRGQEHLKGMNQREQEEFLLAYGPRKVRKAMRAHRRAREIAQNRDKGSDYFPPGRDP